MDGRFARQGALKAVDDAGGAELIYERFVPLACELSVIATRDARDEIVAYPLAENTHNRGILAMTVAPARVDEATAARAREMAAIVGRGLKIVGTYCVEFFLSTGGELLVNEIAPRPHNSGHYTVTTQCSQYEQHVRAICELPLAPPRLLSNAIMMNILGDGTGDHLRSRRFAERSVDRAARLRQAARGRAPEDGALYHARRGYRRRRRRDRTRESGTR